MADSGASPARRRGLSLRWQLTLSYAVFVVVVGMVLSAVGLLLLRFVPEGNLVEVGGGFAPNRSDLMMVFVRYAGVGLAFLAVLGLSGGWLLAGRMLRGLHRITEVAGRVREGDLDCRIAMEGRTNELVTLADTFDDMVGRIQSSNERHRRFAANASHELRTPHAVIRTLVEVARTDPALDTAKLLDRIEETNERSIVLGEALLSLAVAENGASTMKGLDLAKLAEEAIDGLAAEAVRSEITLSRELERASPRGDEALLRQLISNVLQNAVVHNHAGGSIRVATATDPQGRAVFEVSNTGPVVPDEAATTLAEPFVRAKGRTRKRDGSSPGVGLGLSIVASIADAHAAELTLVSRAEGGLIVRVHFPPG